MTKDYENLTVYIYYKIPTQKHMHFLNAVKSLNNAIMTLYPFLKIRTQKRPELDADKRELWMETYEGVPSIKLKAFSDDLAKLVEQYGLPSERKFEVFSAL